VEDIVLNEPLEYFIKLLVHLFAASTEDCRFGISECGTSHFSTLLSHTGKMLQQVEGILLGYKQQLALLEEKDAELDGTLDAILSQSVISELQEQIQRSKYCPLN
jgi:hypothetical protein